MLKVPNIRYEDKVVIASLLAGIGAWLLDAFIDSQVFSHQPFLKSLILEITPHELYFRLFMMLAFFIFGVVISGTLARRKFAEEELRKALTKIGDEKARTEAIISAIPDGISILDRDYRVRYQNEVHRSLVGDQLGKVCYEKYANLDTVCPGCPVARSFEDGGNHVLVRTVPDQNGGKRHIEISSSPLRNAGGEIIAGIEAVRDITVRKQAEEELQQHRERLADLVDERTAELRNANVRLQQAIGERERMEEELLRVQRLESLGLLAGGIAHDFNNLLGSIMGSVSLAMVDVDSESPAFQQLAKADRAAVRAQDLIRQLLTFSRGGAPVKKLIALAGLLSEAAGLSLGGSRVLHELAIPRDLWPVEADEGQMMQVLSNVLINADQAMPSGGIIRITAGNITLGDGEVAPLKAGRYVKISIRDEGTGIPREHLARIFDPFFTTKQKGSGLGLAATYSIVRKHDGQITVESELGTGTVLHVYLPASQGEVPFLLRDDKFVKGSGKVLVMDDEEEMRRTTGDMLVRMGYTVEYADEGGEACAKFRMARESGKPFSAVIMDLTIPSGMGGKEAVRKLLEIDPEARVIVSSGYSDDPVMADYRSFGFQGAVSKPYRMRELSEVVAKVMSAEEK
jgi:signal transduction histidine kinase/ActR/RegA family two-component response regulator